MYLNINKGHSKYTQWWKVESFSSRVRKKTKMPTLAIPIQNCTGSLRAISQERETKGTQIGNEKVIMCVCRQHDLT